MIKQKAPKNMTAPEFVTYICETQTILPDYWKQSLQMMLKEPAPNSFTPDQLAVMRELQRNGFNYAAQDDGEDTYVYCKMPTKELPTLGWDTDDGYENCIFSFLVEVLSWQDATPLCFADFAPLDDESTVS